MGTLKELEEHLGNRQVALARELTKHYEEVWRGSIKSPRRIQNRQPKQEFVLVIEGLSQEESRGKEEDGQVLQYQSTLIIIWNKAIVKRMQ